MAECDPVQLIASEQPRLAQEFHDLPATVWAASSRCAGWSNARVVGHLAFYARAYCDSIARALRGDSAPLAGPGGRAVTVEEFLSQADDSQLALAELAPGDLLRELSRSGDELTDLLARLAPSDRDRPAWHFSGTQTIGVLVAFRLYELAFHGWVVRATVDPEAQIQPELGRSLVGIVRQWLP